MRDLLEPSGRVETRGEFDGDRLMVDETIRPRRTNSLFVKTLSLELAAFNACDLGADQRCAVLEVLRTILRPDLELSVVGRQSLEMLLVLVRKYGIAAGRTGKRTIEVILRRFKK